MSLKKISIAAFVIFIASQCNLSSSTSVSPNPDATVSYARDLAPLMLKNCSPCHFPEKGKADKLHTYDRVRRHIRDILYHVQLDPSNKDYMPFKQKKPAWTPAEINLFQQWQSEGFAP